MQITAAALFALLPSFISAAPAATSPNYFTGLAAHSASAIHLQPINAYKGEFYIGKNTTSYCPSESVGCAACPPGNTTVFVGGANTLAMGVVVPGGQQVYVAEDGALSFTQAHSGAVPKGSFVDGFSFTAGKSYGTLSWGSGFIACPVNKAKTQFRVYGTSKSIKAREGCIGLDFLAPPAKAAGAWEYT